MHRARSTREILPPHDMIQYRDVYNARIESLMNHPWKVEFPADRSLISNHVPIHVPIARAAQFIPSNE